MAQLIRNGDFMTEGEKLSAERLANELPADWIIVTNKTLVTRNGIAREIDFIIVAANTVFVIDEKGFRGRIHGNDQFWVFDSRESCESPLNKIDVGARIIAGFIRENMADLRNELGGKPFVVSAVLLSDPSCEVRIQEPRRERIILLDEAAAVLRKLDRVNQGSDLRQYRKTIVEKLRLVPPRPTLPRQINLYTVNEELQAGPYYRCFKATHSARPQSELFRVKLYEVMMGSEVATRQQRELINRDYRATSRLSELGITPQLEMPLEWNDGRYIVVGHKIPSLPTIRAVVNGEAGLNFKSTLAISVNMLNALSKMHEAGVIHRNLSPDNTFVDPENNHLIQFTDFDFSRIENEYSVASLGDEISTDFRYAAPELADGLSQASEKSDIFSAGMILNEILLPLMIDEEQSHWNLLKNVIESMSDIDPHARWSSAREAYELLEGLFVPDKSDLQPKNDSPTEFYSQPLITHGETGLLDSRYRVIRILGEGSTAITFLAEDTEYGGVYVLKKIKDPTLAKRLVSAEFNALRNLPPHPRIVKIIDANSIDKDFHLKMEYVEGECLHDLHKTYKWDALNVRRLIEQLLEGLAFLDHHNRAHRDISPSNVIITNNGPKIIDFGFATEVDFVGQSNVGTIPFRSPELDTGSPWNRTCDMYSVGAIGLWLLFGCLPFNRNINGGIIKSETVIPKQLDQSTFQLATVLLRAISPSVTDRFETVAAFVSALQSSDSVPVSELSGTREVNHWVNHVQSLYRNSRVGNSDNRGLDTEFARQTYVPTLLDTKLLPEVLQRKYAVVLLSGNPGDGKTAFLEMVYDALSRLPLFSEQYKNANGWKVEVDGHFFQANYDASESHEGLRADAVLDALFRPFEGEDPPAPNLRLTVLVAINDGKMREFILYKRKYAWLGREVSWFTGERINGSRPQSVVVIDLKNRSVVGEDGELDLMERVLDKLVDAPQWSICEQCRARERCPIKFNRDSLFTPNSGPRQQLRRLLQVSHLRRDRHITIRDMRSTLSFIIVGDTVCEDIHNDIENNNVDSEWINRLYFNAAFNPYRVAEDNLTEFAQCDPALSTHPRLERILWHLHRTQNTRSTDTWFTTVEKRTGDLIRSANQMATPTQWIDFIKKRLFFEGNTFVLSSEKLPSPVELLPYRYLTNYLNVVTMRTQAIDSLAVICEGISRANGISDEAVIDRYLCIRTSHDADQDLTVFKRFPILEFHLQIVPNRSEFIETLTNTISLLHRSTGTRLAISLDLFEILMRMNEGYLPGSEEQVPYLIDLDQFENQLLNEPTDELLLLESGRRIHRIRQQNGVIEYVDNEMDDSNS